VEQIGKAGFPSLYDYFLNSFGTPDSREFENARMCMMRSLAAYAVVCYLLQVNAVGGVEPLYCLLTQSDAWRWRARVRVRVHVRVRVWVCVCVCTPWRPVICVMAAFLLCAPRAF
jgi:hypothetical protein